MALTYAEKLRDPKWQRRRLEIMNRDEWKCQRCQSTKIELQVHHTQYVKGLEPWEASDMHLFALCKKCHIKVGDLAKQIADVLPMSTYYTIFEMCLNLALCRKPEKLKRMLEFMHDHEETSDSIVDFPECRYPEMKAALDALNAPPEGWENFNEPPPEDA